MLSGDKLSQRPGYTHLHLTEDQVTDLDYTYAPGGHGAHHDSIDHSLAHQESIEEAETQEPRVTHSGVTLPFLHHQVGLYAPLPQ